MAQNYPAPEYSFDYQAQDPRHQQRPYAGQPQQLQSQQLQHTGAAALDPLETTALQTGSLQQHQHPGHGYGSTPIQQQLSAFGAPSFGGASLQATPLHARPGPKRSRPHDEEELGGGLQIGSGLHGEGMAGQGTASMAHPHSLGYSTPQHHQHQQYHGHRLPESARPLKIGRYSDLGGGESSGMGSQSAVGRPGMPLPAPKPRGPKLKFTPEDDHLLVDLKENRSLTWKQIAEFFPGRSSGTLQVRYCTKLKAKTTHWTEETIQKLRTALQDYDQEKWRIVSNKVGTGFTPAACREKAQELHLEPEEMGEHGEL